MQTLSKKVAWRDLWAFVIYFVVQTVLGYSIVNLIAPHSHLSNTFLFLMVNIITSLCVILYLAWSHRHLLMTKVTQTLHQAKKHARLIIWAYVLYMFAILIVTTLLQKLPEQWQFKQTGNQEVLLEFFSQPLWLPLVFLSLVVLAPITEELLFRHVLIRELGQKFGFLFMGLVSIVVFASLHMSAANSPFEIFPYLLMGIMFVVAYIKSGCNIAVSIFLHMLNNAISFIGVLMQLYY